MRLCVLKVGAAASKVTGLMTVEAVSFVKTGIVLFGSELADGTHTHRCGWGKGMGRSGGGSEGRSTGILKKRMIDRVVWGLVQGT